MAVKIEAVKFEGNLTADPELGHTTENKLYVAFTLAANDRRYNEETERWENVGEPVFQDVVTFGEQANNIAESLRKGDRVIAHGDLRYGVWHDQEGNRRQGLQLVADAVGPSLRFNTVEVHRSAPKAPSADVSQTGPVAAPVTSWDTAQVAN